MSTVKPDSEVSSATPLTTYSLNKLFRSSFDIPTSPKTQELRARYEASHTAIEDSKPITPEQRDKWRAHDCATT